MLLKQFGNIQILEPIINNVHSQSYLINQLVFCSIYLLMLHVAKTKKSVFNLHQQTQEEILFLDEVVHVMSLDTEKVFCRSLSLRKLTNNNLCTEKNICSRDLLLALDCEKNMI